MYKFKTTTTTTNSNSDKQLKYVKCNKKYKCNWIQLVVSKSQAPTTKRRKTFYQSNNRTQDTHTRALSHPTCTVLRKLNFKILHRISDFSHVELNWRACNLQQIACSQWQKNARKHNKLVLKFGLAPNFLILIICRISNSILFRSSFLVLNLIFKHLLLLFCCDCFFLKRSI